MQQVRLFFVCPRGPCLLADFCAPRTSLDVDTATSHRVTAGEGDVAGLIATPPPYWRRIIHSRVTPVQTLPSCNDDTRHLSRNSCKRCPQRRSTVRPWALTSAPRTAASASGNRSAARLLPTTRATEQPRECLRRVMCTVCEAHAISALLASDDDDDLYWYTIL